MSATGRRPHEPASIRVTVSRLPGGALRFETPTTPGWAAVAHCPAQVRDCIERAFIEVQVAAYAAWRGVVYDLAETEEKLPPGITDVGERHPAEPVPAPAPPDEVARKRHIRHPRTHEPTDWQLLSDGYLLSPAGRRYSPESRQGRTIVAALGSRGLTG